MPRHDDDDDAYSADPPPRPRRAYDDDDDLDADDDLPRIRRNRGDDVAARVIPPAIALMVVSTISFIFLCFYCPINLYIFLNDPQNQQKPKGEQVGGMIGAGVVVPLMALASLAVGICGYLMYSRKSYSAAMTGAVISCIPCCSPLCIVGIPFGIWALIVLYDPLVKEGFSSGR
jgi:hypothetical protein